MTTQRKTKVTALIAAVIAGCLVIAAIVLSGFTTAYAVTVDGELWGYVSDPEEVDTAIENVENEVGKILDKNYTLKQNVACEKTFIHKDKVTDNMEELETDLYNAVPDITDGYVLRVDGETVGIGNEAELSQTVENVKNQYVNENTVDVTVLSDVEVSYDTVPAKTESDTDAIADTLTAVTGESVTYAVHDGETVAEVANDANVPVEQVIALNPQLNNMVRSYSAEVNTTETPADFEGKNVEEQPEENEITESYVDTAEIAGNIALNEGTVLYVEPETVLLSVQSVDLETREEETAYKTEKVEDDTLPVGETKIIQEGQNGSECIYEYVTKMNGTETERAFDSFNVIEEPVTEIVSVGTKEPEPETEEAPVPEELPVTEKPAETTAEDITEETTEGPAEEEAVAVSADSNVSEETDTETYTYYTYGTNGTVYSAGNNGGSHQQGADDYSAYDHSSSSASSAETVSEADSYSYATDYSSNADLRNQIVAYAKQFVGCSYVHGGHGPYVFDCSGLTGYVYAHFGYSLPWTVEGQYACGTYVPLDVNQMLPGDLIFWSYGGSTPTHVGMYIGNGQYIQATKPGDVVRINTVSSYPGQPLVGCRRIIN